MSEDGYLASQPIGADRMQGVTTRELLDSGQIASLFGSDLIVSRLGNIQNVRWVVAEPQFVGVMPIRQNVEVIPRDDVRFTINASAVKIINVEALFECEEAELEDCDDFSW